MAERRRYKLGAAQARQHALAAAGYMLNDEGKLIVGADGKHVRVPRVDMMNIESLRWSADPGFPEVPAEVLARYRWQTLVGQRWLRSDNIQILEARALVNTIERIVNCLNGCEKRILILGDNLAVILAFGRCRAKVFRF